MLKNTVVTLSIPLTYSWTQPVLPPPPITNLCHWMRPPYLLWTSLSSSPDTNFSLCESAEQKTPAFFQTVPSPDSYTANKQQRELQLRASFLTPPPAALRSSSKACFFWTQPNDVMTPFKTGHELTECTYSFSLYYFNYWNKSAPAGKLLQIFKSSLRFSTTEFYLWHLFLLWNSCTCLSRRPVPDIFRKTTTPEICSGYFRKFFAGPLICPSVSLPLCLSNRLLFHPFVWSSFHIAVGWPLLFPVIHYSSFK